MENVSMEKVIDGKSIRALTNGDKIENDIFCVERKFDEYWVFLKHESSGLFLLGCSPLASEAREIMELFVWGCSLTITDEIKYNLGGNDEKDKR